MKTQPTHTPTPWWINKATDGNEICSGPSTLDSKSQSKIVTVAVAHGPSGEWSKVGPIHAANAALIVLAVNSHHELLEALTIAYQFFSAEADAEDEDGRIVSPDSAVRVVLRKMRQAIAKAEGK